MPPQIDLEPYKDTIISLYQDHSIEHVRQYLSDQGIEVVSRTIKKRLNQWNVSKYVHTDDTAELRLRIAALFYQCAFKDPDILDALRQEGFTVQPRALKRIRLKMGLVRRLSTRDREEADRRLLAIVKAELEKGRIEGFGRNHLYYHFRSQQHIISRFVRPTLLLNQHSDMVLPLGTASMQ